MPPSGPVSRRKTLTALGGIAATTVPTGTGGATERGRTRVTVGYDGPIGKQAVRDRAHDVVYEFAFDALTVIIDERDVTSLRTRPGIRYVERDRQYVILAQRLPWGIDRVGADEVHGNGPVGEDAHVAIVDTGISRTHPDLTPNLGDGVAFRGGIQTNNWQDDNGHGTHCAGIAAAVDNDRGVVGIAPSATLHAVKVIAAPGAGLSSDVAKGIEWVADQGYDVANMSIGGDRLKSVREACKYAAKNGVTLIAAAGNSGPCTDCVRYPAAYPEVIAVSSTTRDDELADSSSQGPQVDLAAPGEKIYSTYLGGYRTLSGTSMACPHVSGAAGALAANGHTREERRRRLRRSAEEIGLSPRQSGAGLLNVPGARGDSTDSAPEPTSTDTPRPDTPSSTASPPSTQPGSSTRTDSAQNRAGGEHQTTDVASTTPSPRRTSKTTRRPTATRAPTTDRTRRPTAASTRGAKTATSSGSEPGTTSTARGGDGNPVSSLVDTILDILNDLLS